MPRLWNGNADVNLDKRDPGYQEQAKWIMNDKASAVILLGTEMVDADIDLIRGMTCPFIVIDYWKEDMSFDAMLINNADFCAYGYRVSHCQWA